MTNYLAPQKEYDVKPRRISGTRAEKLEQIDAAIQELLDIKLLECAAERPSVRFVAAPKPRSRAVAMTIMILALLVLLVLLLGVRASHAQTADPAHGGRILDHQNTALIGTVWWIGNKTGG